MTTLDYVDYVCDYTSAFVLVSWLCLFWPTSFSPRARVSRGLSAHYPARTRPAKQAAGVTLLGRDLRSRLLASLSWGCGNLTFPGVDSGKTAAS